MITVIDAGVGNLGNLVRALECLGARAEITLDPHRVAGVPVLLGDAVDDLLRRMARGRRDRRRGERRDRQPRRPQSDQRLRAGHAQRL
mgnify:CR=1 FL=1